MLLGPQRVEVLNVRVLVHLGAVRAILEWSTGGTAARGADALRVHRHLRVNTRVDAMARTRASWHFQKARRGRNEGERIPEERQDTTRGE